MNKAKGGTQAGGCGFPSPARMRFLYCWGDAPYFSLKQREKQASEKALRATVAQLKGELDEKQQKLDDFEKKARRISDALISAVSKADEIEKLAVYKYNQEMEQLKSFHARWVAYYARLMKKYPLIEKK